VRDDARPGRICPMHYRYDPATLARPPDVRAESLYVVGGLYGNLPALDAIERLVRAEPVATRIVFNGDFHWFDADPDAFGEIDRRVRRHLALRGNVETELASDDDAAGCGCAYPAEVGDEEVARSNAILARLREVARGEPARRRSLGALPMTAVAEVGGARIAIVHGDAESLAGWGFAHDRLDDRRHAARLAWWIDATHADVFASSHTCLPVCRVLHQDARRTVVVNNGAAGMPNFAGTRFGVVTRISTRPAPTRLALYGVRLGALHVDAVRIDYDHDDWLRRFTALWPEKSPAHRSYHRRIVAGPDYSRECATPAVIAIGARQPAVVAAG
jgi:hypothetical protein